MAELGRILIADDEETFLLSTVDLLRREGYECDGVPNAEAAIEMLRKREYDLLVADILMPGNIEMELVMVLPEIMTGLPVIVVTGHPSLKTAIVSIELRIVAYLIKPFDLDEFLKYVRIAITSSQLKRGFFKMRRHLEDLNKEMEVLKDVRGIEQGKGSSLHINDFFELNYQNIVGSLSDLIHLVEVYTKPGLPPKICHLFKCPRLDNFNDALVETVGVLEKTKSAFKSKELGELRKKLEDLIKK